MNVPFTKNIHNFFKGPQNPGFRPFKVQTETFFKKDSRDFKKFLGFLCILSKPGKENWKFPFFWVFIILKKQCDQFLMKMNPCKIFYFQGLFLPLKVSQSRKQFMVASILPKNKRNGLRIVSGYAFEIF